MYNLFVRPFVKNKNLEVASRSALRYFKLSGMIPGARMIKRFFHSNRPRGIQREVFGLQFYNPIGLGAGLDRKGEVYNDINDLGFSFVEIGPMDASGMRNAINNLQNDPQDDILAACINNDFLTAFTLGYDFCDFFVIELAEHPIESVIDPLLDSRLAEDKYKPIVVKLPEDIRDERLVDITDYVMMNGVDAIEARSLGQIKRIKEITLGRLPVIANCHIRTPQQASDALDAGASLVEVRSGIVYDGPKIVDKIHRFLLKNSSSEK